MTADFVVSVHDVAPWSFAAGRRWLDDLDARGVPATLLLVPGPWRGPRLPQDAALVRWLHDARGRGHELALHGYAHRAVPGGPLPRRWVNAVVARGCAEFCALDERAAHERLTSGLAALASVGIVPEGFTPPGWLASPGSMAALRGLGLEYTTSHLAVHDLRTGRRHRMPALSHRPGGLGEGAGARLMPAAARRWSARGRAFRIALHPADLDRPGLRERALEAVDLALAAGARPCTYAGLVRAARRAAA
ncbi:polysaccharide deacetylase family protein [Streptomyces cinnamoneus]|uniref:polysaccharide deacetylase family protein n=1 Tax=Streptomyces cinnamoneus TaxID=53446 RepID=UPI0033FCE665